MRNIFAACLTALVFGACASKPVETKTETPAPTPEVVAPTKAQATLSPAAGGKGKGMVHFMENDGKMTIEVMVEGVKAGPHGFHVHETGDCSAKDFTSAGGHFNPTHMKHAAPDAKEKHEGDMGNLMANKKGVAKTTMTVEGMTLKPGAESIIGKAVIVHAGKDDLKSQPAGNSGPRELCGVIEAM